MPKPGTDHIDLDPYALSLDYISHCSTHFKYLCLWHNIIRQYRDILPLSIKYFTRFYICLALSIYLAAYQIWPSKNLLPLTTMSVLPTSTVSCCYIYLTCSQYHILRNGCLIVVQGILFNLNVYLKLQKHRAGRKHYLAKTRNQPGWRKCSSFNLLVYTSVTNDIYNVSSSFTFQ